jgi:hypothetical protein
MKRIIIIIDIPEQVKEFLALPTSIYKNIVYNNLYPKSFEMVSYMTEEGNHYFSSSYGVLTKFGDKYVIKERNKSGLSYKDGKVNIWFGGNNIESIRHIDELFKVMNWNFIERDFYSFITKSSLLKLFKGKITNTRDLLKHYVKSVRLDVNIEKLYQTIKISNIHGNGYRLDKSSLYMYGSIAKDINHLLDRWQAQPIVNDSELMDLIRQYNILNKKVDFRWSKARIKAEHNIATKTLMAIEAENIPDETIDYPAINLPYGIDLLNTRRKIFEEGKNMSHCIYTNYWSDIKRKKYVAFHVTRHGEEATLGCIIDGGKLKFNQVYQKGNKLTTPEMKEFCLQFIADNMYSFKDSSKGIVGQNEQITPQVAVQEPDFYLIL